MISDKARYEKIVSELASALRSVRAVENITIAPTDSDVEAYSGEALQQIRMGLRVAQKRLQMIVSRDPKFATRSIEAKERGSRDPRRSRTSSRTSSRRTSRRRSSTRIR